MARTVDLIFYNKVMDRIAMRQLISRLISHFGITYTTHVLDQLKTLGFQQATLSSISLGIDDLLTAPSKSWLIEDAEQYSNISEKHQNYGNLHAVEKLRQLIETWYATSEYLKQEMNPNFRMTDPLNPVHMMSFSGARGSTSQVHQLVGMRGLMSDPQGQIIDLPIQSNFREGLSLTEYIISCYGARKGIVDTAVRTSDAGYLTRRLVEVVQRIVVRKIDCETFYGIFISDFQIKKKNFHQKLIGRVLAENIYINNRCFATRNQDIGVSLSNTLTNLNIELVHVRSPLTCKSILWICQLCYGWNLTNGNLIEIGEAVGIIAGQSIGEPGTQLTLRTFHTGGVFTGDIAEHVRTPFNGIIKFDENLIYPTRTRHGTPAWICHSKLFLNIQSRNKKYNLTIPSKSLLLVRNYQYVESKQVIAEIRAKTSPFKEKVQKYIYSNFEGEMCWSTKVHHASQNIYNNIHPILKASHIWVLSGKSYNKNDKLPILFYENQDKIESKIIIGKEKVFYFTPKHTNQVNLCIFNSWIFGKNKTITKTKMNHGIYHYLENVINENIILYGYDVKKKRRNFFLRKQYTIPFVLKLRKDCVLRNNETFASLDPPKYKLEKSGILKYGTIQISSINQNSTEDIKKKIFKPKYKIVKTGNFFFIPENVYISTKNLALLLVKNNQFIRKGTLITSNIISNINGLIKIKKGINNIYEVKILPGTIYYPNETHQISKQITILIPPEKKIFNQFQFDRWIYLQWIMPSKEKPFALMRPVIEYQISDELNKTNLLNLLKKNEILKIKSVSFLFYKDGAKIRIVKNKNVQLLQICLIVYWKNRYFLEKAHLSFLKIKTRNKSRNFLQISLIKYYYSILNNKSQQNKFNSQFVLKKNHYDIFLTIPKNQIINKHEGIIRVLSYENNEIKPFLMLCPYNLVKVSKINQLINFNKNKNFLSNQFFDFSESPQKNFDELEKIETIKKTSSLLSKKWLEFSGNNFGLIGNLNSIICIQDFFECFYCGNSTKIEIQKINNEFQNTYKNEKWYFIDEDSKIYKFILNFNININFFVWYFPFLLFEKIIPHELYIGKLCFENFYISKYSQNFSSSQIIGMHINYLIIRLAKPYLATEGAFIHSNYGDSVKEGDTLITLIYERLKSRDIIQGLPKVEQLLEARSINSVSINLENSFDDWNNDMKKFIGNFWGFFLSTKIGTEQAQINLVDQIQKVYQSQGVHVSNKHIEIIVRQMTSKVTTSEDGIINIFLPGELIELSRAQRMNRILEEAIPYKPILLGITKSSLNTQSFISEASFQETTRILAKAALKGRTDWLKGLKENVILGGLIPAGTGSQEVLWQKMMEKKKEKLLDKNNLFKKKIKHILIYQNKPFIFPNVGTVHNILKN
uniref:DNA-directed RNA polymerase subunit beta'' n=1 Tax=Cheilolejeunea xanthocarpa TaxID=414193 RepID=A0A4Y5P4Y7_9MARC|nr:RNA polymerase beta' subunit [Cheilolejeunea xanthocarpa]QCW58328.1 RNA polymerase beta' subunit [Cheilolejeunea xanthocarpa]